MHLLERLNFIRPRTPWAWIIWGILGFVLLLFIYVGARFTALSQIEHCVQRKYEIRYTFERQPGAVHEELYVRTYNLVNAYQHKFPHRFKEDYDWDYYPPDIYANRAASLGLGKMIGLEIYDVVDFTPELGKVIARQRHLEFLDLQSLGGEPFVHREESMALLRSLTKLKKLRELRLGGEWVDDEFIASLGDLSSLESLQIDTSRITEKSVPYLLAKKLKYLSFYEAPMSKEGIRLLQTQFPDSKVQPVGEYDGVEHHDFEGGKRDPEWRLK